MSLQTAPAASGNVADPQAIFDLATGFMRAKHMFVASELGIFEALAERPMTLPQLAEKLRIPQRTTRIVVDAITALRLLERQGDKYANSQVAQLYLSGRGEMDMRLFVRFWNRLSYKRWLTFEESVRLGKGVDGEFNFAVEEQKVFSEGVEAFSAGHAAALASRYEFAGHLSVLDLGGGTGSFLKAILQRHPHLRCTLYEIPGAAAVARQRLADCGLAERIDVVEGDFLRDSLPEEHDVLLLAHVIHVLVPEQIIKVLRQARRAVTPGARLLLVDFWMNESHTEPLMGALMAGEFLVVGGNGDVYSVDEARKWLEDTGWRYLKQESLAGPVTFLVAEAT